MWESIKALADFAYRSAHVELLRRRRGLFDPPNQPILCLWWVLEGTVPTIDEAVARLAVLRAHGPSRRFHFLPSGSSQASTTPKWAATRRLSRVDRPLTRAPETHGRGMAKRRLMACEVRVATWTDVKTWLNDPGPEHRGINGLGTNSGPYGGEHVPADPLRL